MNSKGVVGVRVQSFKEWMEDEDAKRTKISAAVRGLPGVRQIGRTAWLKGADGQCRYPDLERLREVASAAEAVDLTKVFQPSEAKGDFHARDTIK